MSRQRKRRGRNISGMLLLDKPQGMTSNKVLQIVKRLYQAAKAGHTGSLDPLATGMLPICLGEATKFSQYLLDADKIYRVTGSLGIKTNTSDAEGEVIEQRPVNVTEQQLLGSLDAFRGDILQTPSMFSALKKDGQPLYKLARQGKTIEREARPVHIERLDCLGFDAPYFHLEVHCSKGTYIRNLVEDIGEALGCGAHVTVLERLSVAGFESQKTISLEQLEAMTEQQRDALLLPADSAISYLPEAVLDTEVAWYLQRGQAVQSPVDVSEGLLRLFDSEGQFLGLGEINEDGLIAPKRLIQQIQT